MVWTKCCAEHKCLHHMSPSKVPQRLNATRSCWDSSTTSSAHGREPCTGRMRACQEQSQQNLVFQQKIKRRGCRSQWRAIRCAVPSWGKGGEVFSVPVLTCIAKSFLWPFSFQTMSHPSQPSPRTPPFKVLVERCRSEPLSQSTPMGLDQVGGRMQHLLRRRGE